MAPTISTSKLDSNWSSKLHIIASVSIDRVGLVAETHGGVTVIARHWRGWTEVQDADAYERLLKDKVLLGLKVLQAIEVDMFFATMSRWRLSS